ncbi:MAG: hypothetical protein VX213_02755, partial [Chloroflexota bacterium]|nr:hypothetical protein [Chloroflexota bacterium]
MTSFSIDRATYSVGESALDVMVLEKSAFPESFQGHQIIREGTLDNDTLAQNGFEGTTSKRFSEAGRVTGVMRELGPTSNMAMVDGFDFMAASVVHLFDSPDSVHNWMHEIFLKDFEDRVGESVGQGHQLVSATRLNPQGFFDETVGLRVLQGGVDGLISSTVIDFRVGRLLGVVFIGAVGDHDR